MVLFAATGCRTVPLDQPDGIWALRVEVEAEDVAGVPLPLSGPRIDPDLGTSLDVAWELSETAEIRSWPWPAHVSGAERNRIADAIHTALEVGGREGREAEEWLASLDRDASAASFCAVGRLISEFPAIWDRWGLDGPEGLSRAMVIDRMLRRIDGVQERLFDDQLGIRAQTTEEHALSVIRRWNWWLEHEASRQRRAPWDPLEDLLDPEDDPQVLAARR